MKNFIITSIALITFISTSAFASCSAKKTEFKLGSAGSKVETALKMKKSESLRTEYGSAIEYTVKDGSVYMSGLDMDLRSGEKASRVNITRKVGDETLSIGESSGRNAGSSLTIWISTSTTRVIYVVECNQEV